MKERILDLAAVLLWGADGNFSLFRLILVILAVLVLAGLVGFGINLLIRWRRNSRYGRGSRRGRGLRRSYRGRRKW